MLFLFLSEIAIFEDSFFYWKTSVRSQQGANLIYDCIYLFLLINKLIIMNKNTLVMICDSLEINHLTNF